MKTIKIHDKDYVQVHERVKHFNENYQNGSITATICNNVNGVVIIRATVTPDVKNAERYFTGYASEVKGDSMINKNSYVENCETSAVGRALGFMGIGIVDSIASADEVINKSSQDKPQFGAVPATTPQVNKIFALSKELGWDNDMMGDFLELFEVKEVVELNKKQASEAITKLINHPKP